MKTIRNIVIAAAIGASAAAPASAQTVQRTLRAGFAPDPNVSRIQAGGEVEIDEDRGPDCTGFVTQAPTLRLTYAAGREELFIGVRSATDTVLMVRTPSGRTVCSDDRTDDILDPGVSFDAPVSGEYQIWVGTYDEEGRVPAELHISEVGFPTGR